MGGSSEAQQQQVVYNQYPYAQPQQQNLYFQPPQPQYPVHQPVFVNEQPVLQGSSLYPNVPQVHQPMFVQGMPQPQYPQVQVEQPQVEVAAPRQCRWSCSSAKLKQFVANLDAYRVCSFLSIMSFIGYFLFTPHAWPWFLLVAALSIGHCGTKYIKATRGFSEAEPRFLVHALWYSALNILMVVSNLWSHNRYPWSVFTLCIWGIALGFHALKVYIPNTNTKLYNIKFRLYGHFILYVAVVVMVLVAGSRGYRGLSFMAFLVLGLWSLIVALHARKVRKDEERREAEGEQPVELQVVSETPNVAQQQNETENARLVQQEQEVFNSVQQALQEQRAQQSGQVHLFQPASNVYPNAH